MTLVAEKKKFIGFGAPDIGSKEESAVLDVMRSGWLGTGRHTEVFESAFAEHLDVPEERLVAVSSCTMGLMLALKAEGIGHGDEVITSPLTFVATVNAIRAVGAWPVFVDVDSSGCLDSSKILDVVSDRTKAIIPVHLHGQPCDMNAILAIAGKCKLVVIEDAAHAFGGDYFGQPLGTLGHYGVFSFYPTKNITTGDGGMVYARHDLRADEIRVLASQGLSKGAWKRYGEEEPQDYHVEMFGYKASMTDLNAAIGLAQLNRWPEIQQKRDWLFKRYEKAFGRKGEGHSQHIYALKVHERDEFRKKLYQEGVGTGIHYNPLHLEPFLSASFVKGVYPKAELFGAETLSLPLSSTMTSDEIEAVIHRVFSLKEYLK